MERLFSFWKKSFKWKLVSIFILIVLANLLVIGFFVDRQVSDKIQQDDMQFSSLILKQANLNLVRYLHEYERFLLTLVGSEQLQSWTTLSVGRRAESIVPFYVMETDHIKPFANAHPELLSVMLYHNVSGNQALFTTELGIRPGYSMGKEAWIGQINQVQKVTYLADITSTYVNSVLIPQRIPIISMVKRAGFGGTTYVKIDIKPDLLQSILNAMNIGKNGIGFIVDSRGTVIAHPKLEKLLMPLDEQISARLTKPEGGSFILPWSNEMVIYQPIEGTDWKSVIVIPYGEVAGNVYEVRKVVLTTSAFCLLFSIVFIVFSASSVTRRISKIKQVMKQTGQGRIHVPVQVEGEDEISTLAQSYNLMLTDLQEHIKRLAEVRLAEQQAVLFSLQSQIDSHFLYNTLEIINSMATQIAHYEIEKVTVSLAHMFRYTSNYRHTDVTLREEVQHLERYLQIIKIRYGDDFDYEMSIDDDCLDAKCMKVILQPLAENAVRHGFEEKAKRLRVAVRVRRTDAGYVEAVVTDGGAGFDERRLYELTEQLQHGDSHYTDFQRIGLLNIQYRLRTKYRAPDAGIAIGNRPEGGAWVRIAFPYEPNK